MSLSLRQQSTIPTPSPSGRAGVWLLILLILLFYSVRGCAQIASSNPLEYAALIAGNEAINSEVKGQINAQTKTAALQNTIAAEFTKIHEWERKYCSYLQTVDGYASSLKAATTLYEDGVRIVINLGRLKNAISSNPQGIVATMSMNDLYLETATELVGVYTLLKNAVAKGGDANMLTGAERSEMLWALSDRLTAFNKKLSKLTLSIKYYTMLDVWEGITAGIIEHDMGEISRQAHRRWKRAAQIASQ